MTRRLAVWLGAHFALAIVTLLVFLPQRARGLMLYDLGEVTFFVDALRRGLVPGAEFAVNAYGPGRYGMFAWLTAHIDLPDLSVYTATFVGLRMLISALALEVGLRLLPGRRRPWILLPLFLLLAVPGPLHKGFFLAGSLALALGLLAYLEQPSRARALAFGLLLPAVALFRLDLGGFGALVFCFAALGDRRRLPHLVLGWGPLLVGAGLVLTTTAAMGPGVLGAVMGQLLDDIVKNQTIAWPTFPLPWELFADPSLDRALLYLPIVIYGGLLLALLRSARWGFAVDPEDRRRLATLLVLGVLTCNQVRMKPEFGHLLQAGPLMWMTLAVLLSRLAHGWPSADATRGDGPLGVVGAVSVAIVVAGMLLTNTIGAHRGSIYTGSWTIPEDRTFVLDTPLGRAWLNEGEFRELHALLTYLKEEAPPGALWVPTNQPLLYALAARPDVTGHLGVVYYADNPDREHLLMDRLEASAPPVAVFVDDSIEGPERTLERAAPRVHSYLLTQYTEVERFGRFRVMLRRGPVRTEGLPSPGAAP